MAFACFLERAIHAPEASTHLTVVVVSKRQPCHRHTPFIVVFEPEGQLSGAALRDPDDTGGLADEIEVEARFFEALQVHRKRNQLAAMRQHQTRWTGRQEQVVA